MFNSGCSPASRYGCAVLVSAAAVAARVLLDPVLGDSHPFATFFVAVVISAWHGGVGPSLLTLALVALSALYMFLPPRNSFEVHNLSDQVGMGLFIVIGLVMASMCESLRAAQRRVQSRQKQLEHEAAGRQRMGEERDSRTRQLQEALAAAKTLRGLLPLCAWCKSIRDGRGSWEQLETYLRDTLDVEITHGICPQCAEKMQAEGQIPAHPAGL
jgi:K+-sensing histidine kinase KdpD